MSKMIDVLNTIRDNASADYQNRIPEATRNNLEDIRYAMIDGENIQVANEFMNSLLNKVIKSIIHTKLFSNPLKGLKKGYKPIGDTIEEIYNNFLKGSEYDPTGQNLLKRKLPDTKTVYHRMNYKMQYPVTVSREMLSKAFMSYESLESYVSSVINSLYNSAELDEFMNMKQMIKSAIDHKAMKTVTIADPVTSKENGQEFIKSVKTVSGLMTFPSKDFNGYLEAQTTDREPISTFSRKNEQILILDTATDTSVAVDVLATVFNMSVAEFNDTKKIVIDTFPDKNIRAVLVDEAFFQIYDDLFTVTSFYNGMGLYQNYYLNVWQTLAYSILVNAVAFVVPPSEYSITYEIDLSKISNYSSLPTSVKAGESVTITIQYNDSPASNDVAYVNGVEVARAAAGAALTITNVNGDIIVRNI